MNKEIELLKKQRNELDKLIADLEQDELVQQYLKDVETCKTISGLQVKDLWEDITLKGKFRSYEIDPKCLSSSKYRRHPHADLMIKYYQCSERDKKRWQYKLHTKWETITCNDGMPIWDEDSEYRLKPESININDIDYAAPLREAPKVGSKYWVLSLSLCLNNKTIKQTWNNSEVDNQLLNMGICFATEEACLAVYNAFQSILRENV
jgi:hypothetical protein